jgi:hypothetical protein
MMFAKPWSQAPQVPVLNPFTAFCFAVVQVAGIQGVSPIEQAAFPYCRHQRLGERDAGLDAIEKLS